MQKTANQRDVAKAAGVSISTVSRALSNARGISVELRTQIQKLADELGYRARGAAGEARTLRAYVTANAMTGGLVTFYSDMVEGMNEAAAVAGVGLEIRLIPEPGMAAERLDRDDLTKPAAGTLFVGIDLADGVAARFGRERPLVLVNTYDPLMRFDSIAPNNFYGGAWQARLLLDAGHRSLLYVREHLRFTLIQRHRGFLSAVESVPGAKAAVVDIRENGDAALAALLAARRAGASDWTAVACMNDLGAIRLIHLLEDAGFSVPSDISVVGFDDLPSAAMTTPRLSTLLVDCRAIGHRAIAMMLRRLSEPDAPVFQQDLAVRPVPGGTILQISQ